MPIAQSSDTIKQSANKNDLVVSIYCNIVNNDRVVDGSWESGDELGKTWESRNVFSYGRKDKGEARPEVLTQLLQKCDLIIQEIDSVEYGLTDIQ